ncbi:MAG TPA: hypothetical protein VMM92_02845 [Thermoanaerobaculia bacterium]|nr:hypothetical protein [Thermoanaerobaculia bacterium]
MSSTTPPRHVLFDSTPEIFATDSAGSFNYPLLVSGSPYLATQLYDEVRFVFSIWHPSGQRTIDLDRAYVELRSAFDPEEEHWTKIAEIEPVVPPYAGGESFDGWIVLPVLAASSAFAVVGSGFEPRARLQIRASAYFVA